jgi:release factor glutamine methyltransferase
MPTIAAKELLTIISSPLEPVYGKREAANIGIELIRHCYQVNRLQLTLNEPIPFTESEKTRLEAMIDRLVNEEPLQHVLGSVEFFGLEFKTDHRALIPRPETEELIDWIAQEHYNDAVKILDIGTGTGCIPVSLARHLKNATVSGVDLSQEALDLAHENAVLNKVQVTFQQMDILSEDLQEKYDIIVSNPPYIPEADKAQMAANVLNFEPEQALFVPDNEPLLFYERIANLAINHLNPQGTLYFEIHENFGSAIVDLLKAKGFADIELRQDLQGKDRMTKAIRP